MPESKDYYDLLKDESYKALQKKEIQLSAARDNAYKYTMNSLQNQGYANQGLAQSTNAGIGNSYLSAMGSSRAQYGSEINQINQQQAQDEKQLAENNLASLTTYMQDAYDRGGRSMYIEAMRRTEGANSVDDEGYFTEEFLKNYSPDQQQNLKRASESILNSPENIAYNPNGAIANSGFTGNNTATVGYSTASDLKNNIITQNGKAEGLNAECKFLANNFASELAKAGIELSNGTVVRLEGNSKFAFVIYNNGKWYQTNESVYNSAQNAYRVHRQTIRLNDGEKING